MVFRGSIYQKVISIFLLFSFGGFNVKYVIMYLVDWRCPGILDLVGVLFKVPCSRPDSHTPLNANCTLHRSIKTFTATPEYYNLWWNNMIHAPVTDRSEIFTNNFKPRSESRTDRPNRTRSIKTEQNAAASLRLQRTRGRSS